MDMGGYRTCRVYRIRRLVHEKGRVILVQNYEKPLNTSNGGKSDRE